MSENLQQLRIQINQIDRDILNLLNQRQKFVKQIGEIKQQEKLPIRDLKREEQILLELNQLAIEQNSLLAAEDINYIYQAIMQAALNLQQNNY